MDNSDAAILRRALIREKAARKQAESILEQKSAELYHITQELQSTNEKLAASIKEKTSELSVFENIIDAYAVIDLYGNIIKINTAASELLEVDIHKEPTNIMALTHPDEHEKISTYFKGLVESGSVANIQARIITKSKVTKLVHVNCSAVYDAAGNAIAAHGIVRDITKSKEDEEKLIESENRLSTLILNLENGVLLEDENRKIVLTNNRFCDFFEIPIEPGDMIGIDCSDAANNSKHLFTNPERFITRVDEVLKNKQLVLADELMMNNGRILERDFIPIVENGVYQGHLWSYKDVTLDRSYSKSMEAQKEKYSNIIANMNLGLVEVDLDDRILMINQSFTEISGYQKDELLGRTAADVFLKEERSQIIETEYERRLNGESNSYEIEVWNKNKETRHWLISGAPNYDINGKLIGSIGVHLDITDLKTLEKQKELLLSQLARSNDELHEYAHVVSHDLKSPLRSIYALVSWIKEDNLDKYDDASLKNISLIEETLQKMELLIDDILNYSSLNAANQEYKSINCDSLVNEVLKVIYIPDHIKVQIESPLPVLNGDPTKINQLFQNLLTNAVKFIDKEKGLIQISHQDLKTHHLFKIKDNGIGIDAAFHDKIFKIFNSLNKSKDSTGIGLSIVKKIIDLHDGKIWLESELGKGTTFYFTLKK